jgi:ABC-type phosphate transport system substrate-binding protein
MLYSVSRIVLLMLVALSVSAGELVVIVNPENQTMELTHRQLTNLYMGRTQYYPNGTFALPVDQAPDSEARQVFYEKLVGKSVAQINAYWAKLLFTGGASPPRSVRDPETVLQIVRENRNAIGYVELKYVDDTVRVVVQVQ